MAEKLCVTEVERKPVTGYEGYYEVDRFGAVFSIPRVVKVEDHSRTYDKPLKAKKLKQGAHTSGYKVVSLTKNGISKTFFVHRIVAEAFIDNPNLLPLINHKDENKTNNCVDNLEWCTRSYNVNYGSGKEKRIKKLLGRKHTPEHSKKISESLKRYH